MRSMGACIKRFEKWLGIGLFWPSSPPISRASRSASLASKTNRMSCSLNSFGDKSAKLSAWALVLSILKGFACVGIGYLVLSNYRIMSEDCFHFILRIAQQINQKDMTQKK